MDREEFERIKEAEKEHLRTKKRLQQTLQTLKRRRRVQDTVRATAQSAGVLLRENDALVQALSADTARANARLELALDDVEAIEHPETPSDPPRPSEATPSADAADDMESRAEQIVQQMKMASGPQHRRRDGERRRTTAERPAHPLETEASRRRHGPDEHRDGTDEDAFEDAEDGGALTDTLPEKTMGRMQAAETEEESKDDAPSST